MSNYFKINRKIFNHDIWKNVVDFRLFFLILGKAVFHEDGVDMGGVHVGRGQWLRSRRNLRKDLEFKEKRGFKQHGLATIDRSVKRLIKNGLVTVSETDNGTLFTVVNYEKYQGFQQPEEDNRNAQRNDIGTTSERHRNKNNNALRMQKKYTPEFEEFWKKYPKKVAKEKTWAEWQERVNNGADPDKLIQAAENYSKKCDIDETPDRYIKHPGNFLSEGQDEDLLKPTQRKESEEERLRRLEQWNLDRQIAFAQWEMNGGHPDDFHYPKPEH